MGLTLVYEGHFYYDVKALHYKKKKLAFLSVLFYAGEAFFRRLHSALIRLHSSYPCFFRVFHTYISLLKTATVK